MTVATMPGVADIARRLGGERERRGYWTARCPAHDDQNASLSLKDMPTGPLWKCHAGCTQQDVTAALRKADIIPDREPRVTPKPRVTITTSGTGPRIVATYEYRDADGAVLFESVRLEPKRFYQRRRAADGTWVTNLDGVRLVPYRLPELLASTGRVWIVEGEKDADALAAWGLTATCNPMGAGKWLPGYCPHLAGRDVVIVPDNDTAGRSHAASIVRDLDGIASSIRLVTLPDLPDKGDVSDWMAAGGTRDALEALADATPATVLAVEVATAFARLPLSDAGNAERLVRAHGADLRYVAEWKQWLVWNGAYWQRDQDGTVMRRMLDVVRAIPAEAGEGDAEALAKFAVRSESLNRLNAAIEIARTLEGQTIAADMLNHGRDKLVIRNGTLDLRTMAIGPHRREDLVTAVIRWNGELAWFDATAMCPTWLEFLARVQPDAEVRAYLQMLAGYAMTGHVRERMIAICWGIGRNGKSTFVETLRALLGEYAHQAASDLVMQRRGGEPGAATPELAVLQGKRLVVMDETTEGGRLDEARVKWITGGDSIAARRLYGEPFSFTPSHTIILTTNHRPVIRSGGEAIWDRIQQVPWDVRIPDAEVDRELPQKLLAELPGIFVWAVMGATMWHEYGLVPPESVRIATREYRAESDWAQEFLDEACVIGDGQSVASADLYRTYVDWIAPRGEKAIASNAFGRILTERGFKQVRQARRRAWRGIGLASDGIE